MHTCIHIYSFAYVYITCICLYVFKYVCTHICSMYLLMHLCTSRHTRHIRRCTHTMLVHTYIEPHTHIHMSICTCVYIYVFLCTYIHACICFYLYACVCTPSCGFNCESGLIVCRLQDPLLVVAGIGHLHGHHGVPGPSAAWRKELR